MDVIEKIYRRIERLVNQVNIENAKITPIEKLIVAKADLEKDLKKLIEEITELKNTVDADAVIELDKMQEKANKKVQDSIKILQDELDEKEAGGSKPTEPKEKVDDQKIIVIDDDGEKPKDPSVQIQTEVVNHEKGNEASNVSQNPSIQKEKTQNHDCLPIVNQHEIILGNNSANKPVVQLKLDRLEIPTFNGNLIDWISFRDQFIDLVHGNNNLSTLIKFHLLRNHLKGSALETVNGYQFTAANYNAAWQDLLQRYDRTDHIIEEYIRKFLELSVLSANPHGSKYTQMIDTTNQMLRALPNWKIDVSTWDPWIKVMIVSKLDDHTRKLWIQEIKRKQQVPLKDLIEFLEIRALESQPTQGDRLRQMFTNTTNVDRKRKDQNRRILHVTINCPNCFKDHPIYMCGKLKELKAKERTEIVKKLKLCIRCLRKHGQDQCRFGMCPICNGPHNTLLCYQAERERMKKYDKVSSENSEQK